MLCYCYRCRSTHKIGARCPRQRPWGGRAWIAQRQRILERDHYICQECGAAAAEHIHHITPRIIGGGDEDANLQSLCAPCHRRQHAA